ncbi:hypothetical protein GQX74_008086 [Glossina fuscipes]|nr:hypothetical protein GQX74_008086 [Glossina fuscipes]
MTMSAALIQQSTTVKGKEIQKFLDDLYFSKKTTVIMSLFGGKSQQFNTMRVACESKLFHLIFYSYNGRSKLREMPQRLGHMLKITNRIKGMAEAVDD